jgi:hypothetical protein
MPAVCAALCVATHFAVRGAIKNWPRQAARVAALAQGKTPCRPCEAKKKAQEAAKSGNAPATAETKSVVKAAK